MTVDEALIAVAEHLDSNEPVMLLIAVQFLLITETLPTYPVAAVVLAAVDQLHHPRHITEIFVAGQQPNYVQQEYYIDLDGLQ